MDWPGLAEVLGSRRLLSTLGPRILEMADGRADEGFGKAVERAVEAGHRHSTLLELVGLRVTAMLADADIRSATLKGPRLGEAIYGDSGRRLSSDIDVLVAPDQLPAAVAVVRGMGYDAPIDHVEPSGLPLLHFALSHPRAELPPVELHWRIHWYDDRFASERLLPPAVEPRGDWRPAPEDELAALLLFYARDGFVDLRLASDLSAWWDTYGDTLEPGALGEVIRRYPALIRVITVAIQVAEKIVGLPAEQLITWTPKAALRERMAVRMANPNPDTSSAQLYADIGLIDGLLTPEGQFTAFVRRQLLPSSDVLDQQARHAARRRARSPLARCVGVLARYGLATTRLVRAPETLTPRPVRE